jgi:Sec7-like guanine-nucleotide exchange factor
MTVFNVFRHKTKRKIKINKQKGNKQKQNKLKKIKKIFIRQFGPVFNKKTNSYLKPY